MHNVVVDAPTDVVLTRPAAVRPPGILVRSGVADAERVDPTQHEHLIEPCPLLRQYPRVFLIRSPVAQIDRLVGDVPVAAQDVVAAGIELAGEFRQEALHETEFARLSLRTARTRGQI